MLFWNCEKFDILIGINLKKEYTNFIQDKYRYIEKWWCAWIKKLNDGSLWKKNTGHLKKISVGKIIIVQVIPDMFPTDHQKFREICQIVFQRYFFTFGRNHECFWNWNILFINKKRSLHNFFFLEFYWRLGENQDWISLNMLLAISIQR